MSTPITITAANFIPSAAAEFVPFTDAAPTIAHEAFTAGQTAYVYSADGTYGLSDANGATETNTTVGLFANSGGAGQVCLILKKDPALVIGGAMILGKLFINGATPGQITEAVDATTGWHNQYLGMAVSSTVMNFDPASVCSSAIA